MLRSVPCAHLRPGRAGHTHPHRLKHSGSLWHPGPPAVGDRRAAGAHSLGRAMEAAVERGQAGTEAKTAGPSPSGRGWPAWGSLAVPGDVARAGALSEGSGPVPPDRPWGPLLIPAHHPQTGPRGGPRPGPEPGAGGARGCLSPPGRPRLLTCSVEPARSRLGSCRPQSANIASPSAARCQVPPPAWLEGVAQAARPGTGLRAASLGAGLRGLSPSAPSPTAGLPGSRLLPPPRGLCGPRGPRDPGGIRNPTEHSTLGATAGPWA